MNIEKINAQISEFCTASGFTFGGKSATAENVAQIKKWLLEEFAEYERETEQPKAAKELLDIAYFALTECWQYGFKLQNAIVYNGYLKKFINNLVDNIGLIGIQHISLSFLVVQIEKEVAALNFSFEKTFDALQKSNMSKFLTQESDVEPSILKNLQKKNEDGTQRYKSVGHVKNGEIFAIVCLETGKILKGIHYKEPDFKNCQNF